MHYRADIDGLRAIAIVLVLMYHGGIAFFPSGFVGVDIFFVISGFLITSLIDESLRTNTFSLIDFYKRRLWRLQPVFICLIIVTTVLAMVFFLPDDLIQYTRSARNTTLFISNLFFNRTTTGYFLPDTLLLPLLHTWSLSIEWQCYLFLPLLIILLYKVFKPRYARYSVYVITVLCFLCAMQSSQAYPHQTYYQWSSRLFEFLLGACIALTPLQGVSIRNALVTLGGVLALALLFYIAHLKHLILGYPNCYALLICLATGLLIALGTIDPKHQFIGFLSFKPLVFIGMLSYSLYIWHWVIFAVVRYQGVIVTPLILFWIYLATFILSYLSFRFIEMPSRQLNQASFFSSVLVLLLFPILLTHLSAVVIKNYSGFPQRFNQELVTVYQQLKQYHVPQRESCIDGKNTKQEQLCTLGAKQAPRKTGFLIGDSFSNHYWGFMDILGEDAGVSILAQSMSACITLPGIYLFDWWHFKNKNYQECYKETQKYFQMIRDRHYDYVIIGQTWSYYLSDSIINHKGDKRSLGLTKQRLTSALDKALQLITYSGATPVVIKSTALTKNDVSHCFYRHIKLHQAYDVKQCRFKRKESAKERWFDQLFDSMKKKYPLLIVIDPKDIQCPKNVCRAEISGVPFYRDKEHITDFASYRLGQGYLHQFGNPLR